ncbi:formyl transferase [Candidatus Aerophobetes bacterium]|nr:formyl transferase [Candidatus Aerophobetes bacterium]
MYRIGWFSTGRDKAARDLLWTIWDNIKEGIINNLKISFIFSNRIKGEDKESDLFFQLANSLGIEIISFSSQKFKIELRKKGIKEDKEGKVKLINKWRNLYDKEIENRISKFDADLIVLAGYMLILGEKICKKYSIINLHPAAPDGPKGTWQEVIWNLIENKAQRTGVMMHLVTPELDAGPPLTYCTFSIRGENFDPLWKEMEKKLKIKSLNQIKTEEGEDEPLFKKIREEGVKRELPLIVWTFKAFSEGKIKIKAGKIIKNEAGQFRL